MDQNPVGPAHLWQFLVGQPSRQVKELIVSTTILDFAVAAITIFEPIYLYGLGFGVPGVLLFYLGVYAIYLVIQPLGGKFTRSQGYKHGIMFSTPFLILYYLSLFAIPYSPLFVATAIVAYAIHKMFYWPGFHADFARFGSPTEFGRELGVLVFLLSLASVVGPFFGGVVVKFAGFPTLFVTVAALILASNVPLFLTPEVFVPRKLSYVDAYKRILKPENRRMVVAFMGYGEELLAYTVWPIAIFLAIGGFAEIGAIVSASTMFTAVAGYLIGRRYACGDRNGMIRVGSLFTSLSWLMRVSVSGAFPILGIDTLYRTARQAQGMPTIASVYEAARRYSVTKTAIMIEMSVILGKLAIGGIALAIFLVFPDRPWTPVYLLAAAVSTLYFAYRPPACPPESAYGPPGPQ